LLLPRPLYSALAMYKLLLLLHLLSLPHLLASLHIISFQTYAQQHDHVATLTKLLGQPTTICQAADELRTATTRTTPFTDTGQQHHTTHSWSHVARDNEATRRYPTDFLTVTLGQPTHTIPYLLQIFKFKSIVEEKSHRSLLWSRFTRDNGGDGDGEPTTSFWKFRAPPFPFNPTHDEDDENDDAAADAADADAAEDEDEDERDKEDNDLGVTSSASSTRKRQRRRTLSSSASSGKRYDFGGTFLK